MKMTAHAIRIGLAVAMVAPLAASAGETVIDVNMKAAGRLPFGGEGVKQVSGMKVAVAADGAFAAPEEVCTLIYEKGGDRAVVRVWEDKGHRVFVSTTGDDANPGTEEKPFKTLTHAVDWVLKNDKDKNTDIYAAGGDYDLGGNMLVLSYRVSLYGGFDEKAGWRRDPVIQERVLLPQGFRENWIDDMADRYKDLRRPEHRYRETRITRQYTKNGHKALDVGTGGSPRLEVNGTADTFVDGIAVFGCPRSGLYQPGVWTVAGSSLRTVRNCIFVTFWNNGHAFMGSSPGQGLMTNCIIVGGIVGKEGNARPQIMAGGNWHRNLLLAATGGVYSRVLNMWGNGGLFTENQVHGGNSFGWSGLQGHHGAMGAKRDYVFRGNLLYFDNLFRPFYGAGLVMEDNDVHLLRGGSDGLLATRTLKITGNTFHLAPGVAQDQLFGKGDQATQALGGAFVANGLRNTLKLPPDGAGPRPTIENNRFVKLDKPDRRPGDLVDIERLSALLKQKGEDAAVRPTSPATLLKAESAGAGAVKLSWTASTDPSVIGYIIRYGPRPNSYANHQFAPAQTSATIKGLKPGTWYFTVSAHKGAYVECWMLSNETVAEVE